MPTPITTVTVTPPVMDESSKRSAFRESRSRSVSVSRERSISPLSMPKIQEQREEESPLSSSQLRSSMSLTLRKQHAIVDESVPSLVKSHSLDGKPESPTTPREDDDTCLHGSSEFMLVLYPDDQDQAKKHEEMDSAQERLGKTIFSLYLKGAIYFYRKLVLFI